MRTTTGISISIYDSFINGGFAVKHTSRSASVIPMNQEPEKVYKKLAKGQSGIVDVSNERTLFAN